MGVKTKKDATSALLDHRTLLVGLAGDLKDFNSVLEAIGLFDQVKVQLIVQWIDDLLEAIDQLDELLGMYPADQWKNMELLRLNLPELKKVRALRERIIHIWKRERPGLLPKGASK